MLSAPPVDPLSAATHPDPYPYYAALTARQPFDYDAELGMWLAAGAESVSEVLRCEALGVRPPDEPVPAHLTGSITGAVFRNLIRMTDGPYHRATRPAVETALAALDSQAVAAVTREQAAQLLEELAPRGLPGLLDRYIFALPVGVVARLAGIAPADRDAATRATHEFVEALKPGSSVVEQGSAATTLLLDRLDAARYGFPDSLAANLSARLEREPALANALGLLMQSYEATAGLLGNTLVRLRALARAGETPEVNAAFVREVARHDAPVQNTRRFALEDCRVCGRELRRGDGVLVILAAANRDPAANPEPERFLPERPNPRLFTFGLGGHRCPGAGIAVALTVEAVAALGRAGIDWAMLPEPAGFVAATNVRIPRFRA